MGSLNGDVMVMRNGRSTSQVSVYNYPEHLNPFYEDDQHKRLRFWKISKKDNEGRRNSFSIGNLKDMWAFKSFRLKKKSSTLGVNKTSESPPTLRRDYVIDNSGWNTFDHRLRSNNTSSMNGDSFQRNATYRSSLQSLPTSNDRMGLNRNDGYRSTIQVTRSNPRYQPQQRSLQQQKQQTTGVSPNRRSSQSSMVSTNPFESDDDDYEEINTNIMRSVNGGSTTTLTSRASRTPRKKRHAPAPPTPIHGQSNGVSPPTIRIESSHDSTQGELRIEEDIDIANLTAEIETFVKTKDNDEVEITPKENRTTTLPDTATNSSKTSPHGEDKVEVKTAIKETVPASPKDTNITTSTRTGKTTSTVVSNTSTKELTPTAVKANGQVTTEIITVTTTTTKATPTSDGTKPMEQKTNVAQVSKEIVTKPDESKEIKSNGAIPKKPTNNTVTTITFIDPPKQQHNNNAASDLCIKETNGKEMSEKPIPLRRQSKQEAEVGHVECIHVHVESPRVTPRMDHGSGVSSFKASETAEAKETITNKTPFVLTSPPAQRRQKQQTESDTIIKETVRIVRTNPVNERINELNIKEERTVNTKPEILVKPALSPKPVTKEHGFAEIHKPMRKFTNNQNGHVRRASREENVTSPTVPLQKTKEEEMRDNANGTVINQTTIKVNEEKREETQAVDNLKIVEITTSINHNGTVTSLEKEQTNDDEKVSFNSSIMSNTVPSDAASNEIQPHGDEFELLYRPKPTSQLEWKRSTLAPLETNIPPEKRKSVKDIIESINRSQRLLNAAANKDFPALNTQTSTFTSTTNNSGTETTIFQHTSQIENQSEQTLNENLKFLDEKQREIERLVDDMSPSNSSGLVANGATNSPPPSPSYSNSEQAEAQKLDNSEIFQKCKVKKEVFDYRESSPISSNLDWNPVPKPKRTKPGQD